jgi:hypothetical protein
MQQMARALTARSASQPRLTAVRRLVLVLVAVASSWPSTAAGALEASGSGVPGVEVVAGSGQWPLTPRPPVVSGFDPPATTYSEGHRGVDLGGRPGQPVHAAKAGRVAFAGRIAGRGVVVVDHGAQRTTYEPVSAMVRVGEEVSAGTTIGQLELFGSHCFPAWCLHWGLIEGPDHYLDPLTLVGATPVILLPLGSGQVLGPAMAPGLPVTLGPARLDLRPTDPHATDPAPTSFGAFGLGLPAQPSFLGRSPAG